MWQQIIIGLLFAGALFYLGRLLYRQFTKKDGCAEGCGCGNSSLSIDAIEEKLKKDKRFEKSGQ